MKPSAASKSLRTAAVTIASALISTLCAVSQADAAPGDPPLWQQEVELTAAAAGRAFDYYGWSVAISGDTAVVGAREDYPPSAQVGGAVYIYVRKKGGSWSLQQRLAVTGAGSSFRFGESVAIDKDTLVVGAIGDYGTAAEQGSAFVFVRESGKWFLEQKLFASDATAQQHFGRCVGVSGDNVIVGSYASGAYVFHRSSGGWRQEQKLINPNATDGDYFGFAVGLSGDTAIVGALGDTLGGSNAIGSASIFVRSGTKWLLQQKLRGSAVGDQFGRAVGIDANTAVVGIDNPDSHVEQVAVYVRANGRWSLQQSLDGFRGSVSLRGDTIAMGAPRQDDTGGSNSYGAVYTFARTNGAWSQQAELRTRDSAVNDQFGSSVATSGEWVIAGADVKQIGANYNQGAAYVFLRSPDTDGDGLPDAWETEGVTIDGVFIDLPKMGANPRHKDLFVHAEWMQRDPARPNAPFKPQPAAVKIAMDTFARAPVQNPDQRPGVNLHFDAGPDSIMKRTGETWGSLSRTGADDVPYQAVTGTNDANNVYNWAAVDSVKAMHFGPSKRAAVFHYLLFCNTYPSNIPDSSGLSRGIPAADLIVTLGHPNWTPVGPPPPKSIGTVLEQAGTFLHELGHNLNLRHGGFQNSPERKPNYLSLMNYNFQVIGVLNANRTRSFDYSRTLLDPLNEGRLDENVGIKDPAHHLTLWKCPFPQDTVNQTYYRRFLPSQALDWNLDGVRNSTNVPAQINCDSAFDNLLGSNDWPRLDFRGGGKIGDLAGAGAPSTMTTPADEPGKAELLSADPPALLAEEAIAPHEVITITIAPGNGFTIQGDASGSVAVNATIVSWLWDFGDGTTGSGKTVTHTYAAAGEYFVTVLVTDSNGSVNLVPQVEYVTIPGTPPPTPTPTPTPSPTATPTPTATPSPTPTPIPSPGDSDPRFTTTVTSYEGSSVNVVITQPDGKTIVGGDFEAFAGCARRGIARVNPDGTCDQSFDAGLSILYATDPADRPFLGFAAVRTLVLQPDGKILVGLDYPDDPLIARQNPFRLVVRLNPNGTLDKTFDAGVLKAASTGTAAALALQPDGKIIVAGAFTYIRDGVQHYYIARLNSDGSLDPSYTVPLGLLKSGAGNDHYLASVLQTDGKLVVAGLFNMGGGSSTPILRLNSDGSLDPDFNVYDANSGTFACGFAPGSEINAVALQPDGKIVIAGTLQRNGGGAVAFARLNADGSPDTFANPVIYGSAGGGLGLALQPDGKIMAVGDFEIGSPATTADVIRLKSDGTVDESYNAGTGTLTPDRKYGGAVHSVALHANGKVAVGGQFSWFNGKPAEGIMQIDAAGGRDSGFDSNGGGTPAEVEALVTQPDGKVLVGFLSQSASDSKTGDAPRSKINSTRTGGIGRINADGTTDASFKSPFADATLVQYIALQTDGKILVGGELTLIGPSTNETFYFARLNANGTLDSSFHPPAGGGYAVVLPSGKIVTSGYAPGQGSGLVRLNADGSLDGTFFHSYPNGVTPMALQADGRIIVLVEAFNFGVPTLERLNSDGSLDSTFAPGSGPDDRVRTVVVQPDGKILIAGQFFNFNGTPRDCIARLNSNGSLDTSFVPANPNTFQSDKTHPKPVGAVALQPDGRIIVGSRYNSNAFQSTPNRVFRLNTDGTLDPSFPLGRGLEGTVLSINAIVLQPGGNPIIGGGFDVVNGAPHLGIARVIGSSPTVLANISTRLRVENGDNALIGGFIITGTGQKKVLIRAIGPSLPVAGALADPTLTLNASSGQQLVFNDNWSSAPNAAQILATKAAPARPEESAILTNLNPGAYTTIVRGANSTTGVASVEVYDLDSGGGSAFANISTRGVVQTGDDVMIGGFIIVGSAPQKVIVRATGPSLPLAGTLADPTLELRDGNGTLMQADDNWRTGGQAAEITASQLAPKNDLESAIIRTLAPGAYTAIVRGVNAGTGIGLIEVYALQ